MVALHDEAGPRSTADRITAMRGDAFPDSDGSGICCRNLSMSAKNGGGGLPFSVSKPVYAAAKSGLLGLARGLAVELGPSQVTVNAVCPGPSTRRPSKHHGRRARMNLCTANSVHLLGTLEDVAAAVAFLCSPEGASSPASAWT